VTTTRRQLLQAGGVILAGFGLSIGPARGQANVDLLMAGTANGSAVWFDPIGIRIAPGETLRWTNVDAGNAHTTTAYHPANGHSLRLPDDALPWDSGYLLPQQSFAVTLTVPGVYDYFCRPHEHAGMVGRIVVMASGAAAPAEPGPADDISAVALAMFPSVADIVRLGIVPARAR
jgi:plastocyanin